MNLKKALATICVLALGYNFAQAQFADFKNYPVTVVPNEPVDSTRGHFWGYMFGSYYTKVRADSQQRGNTQYSQLPQGSNAFSLQRLYLGYDYFLNKQFSFHIVLAHEENNDASFSKVNSDNGYNRGVYVKYANMEWNFYKTFKLSIGAITTPSFAITEEPFWGYRSFDRTIMDMKGITNSNDMGASIGGKIWSKKDDMGVENACIGFNVMAGNGTGSIPDNSGITADYTVWHKYYGDFYIRAFNDKLVLDIYGDGRTWGYYPVAGLPHDIHQEITTGRIFLGYKTKNISISALYFQQTEKNLFNEISGPGVPTGGDTIDNIQEGFSIMAAIVVLRDKKTNAPKLSLIGRYDAFNPDITFNANINYGITYFKGTEFTANSITESYYVAGFDWQPIKQIHFMPNIYYDGITDRSYNTTIPTPATPANKFSVDFIERITFYYQFFKN